jgi:tripartite-type tricarboxylate transporter receptor subunit TctC
MVLSSHTTKFSLYKKINYDPVKDFAPVSLLASSPFLFVVHPSLPVGKIRGGLVYAS